MGYAVGCSADATRTGLRLREAAAMPCGSGPGSVGTDAERADPDELEALGDEIATLAAHLHAGKHRLLELLCGFDRRRGWEVAGHRTCAHWLAFRTGLDLGTAREHVRVARALERLPETRRSMSRGRLSFSQVRALTRVAEPETEADLLERAEGCTTAQLERMVRAWKKGSRKEEAAWEEERHRSRTLSVFPDNDGMYVVQGRLEPEVGALLMRALEAAGRALYRERRRAAQAESGAEVELECGPEGQPLDETKRVEEARRRRADAIGLVAERALAAGLGVSGETPEGSISGSRAGRYQVMLHVTPDTLTAQEEPGRSELEDGTRVCAETSRRLSCDCAVVAVTHGRDGSVLNVGRRTRTIPPALRRALEVRDRGCRFPGCGLRFADAHHLVHWGDGGETSLANTLLLCRYHHRLVHEGGWKIEWRPQGEALFRDPKGQGHLERARKPPALTGDAEQTLRALLGQNRLHGAEPDP